MLKELRKEAEEKHLSVAFREFKQLLSWLLLEYLRFTSLSLEPLSKKINKSATAKYRFYSSSSIDFPDENSKNVFCYWLTTRPSQAGLE